jgi:hypothetical protein
MIRATGAAAPYGYTQASGVASSLLLAGVTVQYWASDRFNIEGGPGVGTWTTEGADETGLGLVVGAGYSFFQSRKISLHTGLEWAPGFTRSGMVHSVGFTLGFQLL